MTAPFADLRTGGVLRRWLKRAPVEQPIPYQRATYYIGGRQVAYEEWGSREIAHHCRTADAFPDLKPQEELDAPERKILSWKRLIFWGTLAALMSVGVWAKASTLEPQYDETGRPFFAAEGPQCWSGKYHGGPMDCALIDSIAEPAPFDVPRMIQGRFETPLDTYLTTGSYDYLGDPSPVPLPAGVWLLLSAVGSLAWRKKG